MNNFDSDKARTLYPGLNNLTIPIRQHTRPYYWYIALFYCDTSENSTVASSVDIDIHWVDTKTNEVPYNMTGLLIPQIILACVCGILAIIIWICRGFKIRQLHDLDKIFIGAMLFDCFYYSAEIANYYILDTTGTLKLGVFFIYILDMANDIPCYISCFIYILFIPCW